MLSRKSIDLRRYAIPWVLWQSSLHSFAQMRTGHLWMYQEFREFFFVHRLLVDCVGTCGICLVESKITYRCRKVGGVWIETLNYSCELILRDRQHKLSVFALHDNFTRNFFRLRSFKSGYNAMLKKSANKGHPCLTPRRSFFSFTKKTNYTYICCSFGVKIFSYGN